MEKRGILFLATALSVLSPLGAVAGKAPCRDVSFRPLPQGTMLYGDPLHLEDGKPFAKIQFVFSERQTWTQLRQHHFNGPVLGLVQEEGKLILQLESCRRKELIFPVQ